MTIALESKGTSESTGGTTTSIVLNTASANEFIALAVVVGTPISPLFTIEPTLTIASAGGLTWTPLGHAGGQAFFNTRGFGLQVWTAPAPTPLTNATIEIGANCTIDDAASIYLAYNGVTAPLLDPNGALPVQFFRTNNPGTGDALPQAAFSTSLSPDIVVEFLGSNQNVLDFTAPPTLEPTGAIIETFVENGGGNYWAYLGAVTYATSAPLSGTIVGFSTDAAPTFAIVGLALSGAPVAPGVPTSPACGTDTTSSIEPTWSAPSTGGAVVTYTLQWRLVGAPGWMTIAGITGTSQVILGLAPGSSYEWQVQGVNAGGSGPFTASTICTTLSIAPAPVVPQTLSRWRGAVGINWLGLALVGDAFTNVIGLSDFQNFTEYGNVMRMLVTSPPIQADRKRVFIPRFELDCQVGDGMPAQPLVAPVMMLDYSKDGGETFVGLQKWRSLGLVGEYATRLRWLNLGQARSWVFRVTCTDNVRRQIIGVYVDQYEGLG